jgi:hypothetical protein
MTFNADDIITHVRSLAAVWRQQELDCLNTAIIPPAEGVDTRASLKVLKREIDAMKAHQSAIVLDMLANDLEDLKRGLSDELAVPS